MPGIASQAGSFSRASDGRAPEELFPLSRTLGEILSPSAQPSEPNPHDECDDHQDANEPESPHTTRGRRCP
jgi:hypothetical protein